MRTNLDNMSLAEPLKGGGNPPSRGRMMVCLSLWWQTILGLVNFVFIERKAMWMLGLASYHAISTNAFKGILVLYQKRPDFWDYEQQQAVQLHMFSDATVASQIPLEFMANFDTCLEHAIVHSMWRPGVLFTDRSLAGIGRHSTLEQFKARAYICSLSEELTVAIEAPSAPYRVWFAVVLIVGLVMVAALIEFFRISGWRCPGYNTGLYLRCCIELPERLVFRIAVGIVLCSYAIVFCLLAVQWYFYSLILNWVDFMPTIFIGMYSLHDLKRTSRPNFIDMSAEDFLAATFNRGWVCDFFWLPSRFYIKKVEKAVLLQDEEKVEKALRRLVLGDVPDTRRYLEAHLSKATRLQRAV